MKTRIHARTHTANVLTIETHANGIRRNNREPLFKYTVTFECDNAACFQTAAKAT